MATRELTLIVISIACLPSCQPLNPSEVGLVEIRERYKAVRDKSDVIQDSGHIDIVHDTERGEAREKEEKARERWRTKYIVAEEEEEINEEPKQDEEVASHDVYSTISLWNEISQQIPEAHPPGSQRSNIRSSMQLYLNLFAFYLPDASSVNPSCQRDLQALDQGIIHLKEMVSEGRIWPIKIIDSWGKGADGILEGYMNFMGSFNECLNITVREETPEADFRGKYCTIMYQSRKPAQNEVDGKKLPLTVPAMSVSALAAGLPIIAYANCMPSTCTEQEFANSLRTALNNSGYDLSALKCQTQDEHHDLTAGEIFGIVFFSFIGILLLSASVIDVWADRYPESDFKRGPVRYLLVFSVPFNLNKLFHLETGKNPQTISCLHGLRFLSICWVVIGHQYAFSPSLASNLAELPELANKVAFQMIANGDLSVDTFFFMSGLLVCYGLMNQLRRTGKFNAPLYYVHRIIRLLPPIAICVAFLATLSSLLVEGPLSWYYEDFLMKGCRHSWWMDVSFLGNLVYPFLGEMKGKQNEAASCLPQCWYTGVDMQLYIFTPLMLLPLYFWKRKGEILLVLWTAASVIVPTSIIGAYHLWPSNMMIQDTAAMLEYNHKVYLMPWCRAGPYIVGIWVGYTLYLAKDSPSITRFTLVQKLIGWTTATAVALSIIFGIARYNKVAVPGTIPEMSLAEAALYGGLHRIIWGVVLGWIVLACQWGYGGPISWFLSHPLWQPLSRLTYCIYLTSLPIQQALMTATVQPSYYSHLMKVQETCGILFIVFWVSIALTLASESPILRLEKLLLQPQVTVRRTEETMSSTDQLSVEVEDPNSDTEDEESKRP